MLLLLLLDIGMLMPPLEEIACNPKSVCRIRFGIGSPSHAHIYVAVLDKHSRSSKCHS